MFNYIDIIKEVIQCREPLYSDLEEIDIGEYTMYLNHGYDALKLQGYDYLKTQAFDEIPPFGVVLVKRKAE